MAGVYKNKELIRGRTLAESNGLPNVPNGGYRSVKHPLSRPYQLLL